MFYFNHGLVQAIPIHKIFESLYLFKLECFDLRSEYYFANQKRKALLQLYATIARLKYFFQLVLIKGFVH